MAEKLGLGPEIKELRLGNSFTKKGSAFHTFRYDFKPASVDTSKMATVDVLQNNEVSVTVPHCDGAGTAQTSVFRGPKKPYAKECVLIIDHNTGEITLERLSHNIQLKKTRAEGTGKAGRPLSPVETEPPKQSHFFSTQPKKASPPRKPSPASSSSPPASSPPTSATKFSPKYLNSATVSKDPSLVGVLSESSSDSGSDSSSNSSDSDDSDSDIDKASIPATNGRAASPAKGAATARSNSPAVAHLSMPTNLLSEDLRLSDSGSDSD
nr:EOG090X0IV9 [Polyphemus pediculus]